MGVIGVNTKVQLPPEVRRELKMRLSKDGSEYHPKTHKRCIKCRKWKPRAGTGKGFGAHNSADGLQSICFSCKNVANADARRRNVTARIRHHTGTRCLIQLGDLAPKRFIEDLEEYLGYKIPFLVKHLSADLKEREGSRRKLRDALNEGYHIDHIHPLSKFNIIMNAWNDHPTVDWAVFEECWDPSNLRAIPAAENLAKGSKVE